MRKRITTGISDFRSFRAENAYFIDKTLFVKEWIEMASQTSLVIRPRRFGKTMNMSLVKYFFTIKENEKNKSLFEGTLISENAEFCAEHQGKYPVIHLTFKDVKATTFEGTMRHIQGLIAEVYLENTYLLAENSFNENEKSYFEEVLNAKASFEDTALSLRKLSNWLAAHHQADVLILLDEYDSPIHSGYLYGYYQEIIAFMRPFLGSAFKDNPSLKKGLITGVLRVSKESLFSDVNNIIVYSVLSYDYADKYGFTETEVKEALNYFDLGEKFESVKSWYDGYQIGNKEDIYNPWSISGYLAKYREGFKPHWVNTSSDDMIKNCVSAKNAENLRKSIEELLQEGFISLRISENITFQELEKNENMFWSMLTFAGYLTVIQEGRYYGTYLVRIPNQEIRYLFQELLQRWLNVEVGVALSSLERMIHSLTKEKGKDLEKHFRAVMKDTLSYFDLAGEPEKVAHAYVLGLIALVGEEYIIRSNRESGLGRYDILLIPKDKKRYGVLLEMKVIDKDSNETKIEAKKKEALAQITDNAYFQELLEHDIAERLDVAAVFVGKKPYLLQAFHADSRG